MCSRRAAFLIEPVNLAGYPFVHQSVNAVGWLACVRGERRLRDVRAAVA
jgi:hypothetical protein